MTSTLETIQKTSSQNIAVVILIILSAIGIIFIFIAGGALPRNPVKRHGIPEMSKDKELTPLKIVWNTQDIVFPSIEPGAIVSLIYQAIHPDSELFLSSPTAHNLRWITLDQWNIIDPTAIGFTISLPVNALCKRRVCVRHPTARELNRVISGIFLQNGFRRNEINSSSSEDDETHYDYVLAFEKDATRCTLTTNPELYGFIQESDVGIHVILACSDAIDQRYREQLPFLQALYAGRGKWGYDAVKIRKVVGDFALLSVFARRTGASAVFKKVNSNWELLYITQETPLCSIILKYDIPVEIYGGPGSEYIPSTACFDESGQMLVSPNGPRLGAD